MGIINVTPDSFSGDGLAMAADPMAAALAQAEQMVADGAAILDIGGESTRPGAAPVDEAAEISRTAPVIAALHARWPDLWLSIDTTKPAVAKAALESGAQIINDIAGANMQTAMLDLAAETNAYLVLMHNSARTDAVQTDPKLGGAYSAKDSPHIARDVIQGLESLIARADDAGISHQQLILDPGIGFGKTTQDNLNLIRDLDQIVAMGFPVLLGPSRKNFIGQILDAPPHDRLEGTAAIVAIGVFQGAAILRVHDVKTMARTARISAGVAPGPVVLR